MATDYNQIIGRDSANDPLVPEPVSEQIIQDLPQQSAILARSRQVRLASKTQRQPVLDVLPVAYFVSGEAGDGSDYDGLKKSTTQDWKNVTLTVEELAAIVPIPEAYLDDAQIPVWDEVQPRLTEALGKLIDGACLFGTGKPGTWGTDILTSALNAGNTVDLGTGDDIGVDVASVAELVAENGYSVNGFVSRPGLAWKLIGTRSSEGVPIYQPDLQNGGGGNLYGYPLNEVKNGSWDSSAQIIVGDWSKSIVGMRQDITFKVFDQGVISDNQGKVILNLMQQDSVALRVTMRMAFATANPGNAMKAGLTPRSAFGAVTTASSSES